MDHSSDFYFFPNRRMNAAGHGWVSVFRDYRLKLYHKAESHSSERDGSPARKKRHFPSV